MTTKGQRVKGAFRRFLGETALWRFLRKWRVQGRQRREVEEWERAGRPAPPPHLVKQRMLREYASRYGLRVLVETGTFEGDMIEAMKRVFERIWSIELSPVHYAKARETFRSEKHIELIHGDSGQELAKLLGRLGQPALFWLDGHYSGGDTAQGTKATPVMEELGHLLRGKEKRHVILIDDARCFGAEPSYPTLEALKEFVLSQAPHVDFEVRDDAIRITPRGRLPEEKS